MIGGDYTYNRNKSDNLFPEQRKKSPHQLVKSSERKVTQQKSSDLVFQTEEIYHPNGTLLEIRTNTFEGGNLTDTKSSKNTQTTYQYDKLGRLKNKKIVNTQDNQFSELVRYNYASLQKANRFELLDSFRWHEIREGLLLRSNQPSSYYRLVSSPLLTLKEIARTVYEGGEKKVQQTRFIGQRIFNFSVLDGKLSKISIKNIDGKILSEYVYSYDMLGRVVEEKRYGVQSSFFNEAPKKTASIRYVYTTPPNEPSLQTNLQFSSPINIVSSPNATPLENDIATPPPTVLEQSNSILLDIPSAPIAPTPIAPTSIAPTTKTAPTSGIPTELSQLPFNDDGEIDMTTLGRVGLFFWGKSLYRYLEANPPLLLSLKEMSDFIKKSNFGTKEQISEQADNLFFGRKGSLNTIQLQKEQKEIKKIINTLFASQLRKVLFLDAKDNVLNYIKIHIDKIDEAYKLTFDYFNEEPNFFLKERRDDKWFERRRPQTFQSLEQEEKREESGRQNFLEEANDSLPFTKESIAERYQFYFYPGQMPHQADQILFDRKEGLKRQVYSLFAKTRKYKSESASDPRFIDHAKTYPSTFEQKIDASLLSRPFIDYEKDSSTSLPPSTQENSNFSSSSFPNNNVNNPFSNQNRGIKIE